MMLFHSSSILGRMKIVKVDEAHLNGLLTWFVAHGIQKSMESFSTGCRLHYWTFYEELETRTGNQTQEILETELDVLRDLNCTFQDRMDALGDENLDDREGASWDVKLAIEYKNLQRKILSSILTSCGTGCDLLERELLKCTG